MSVVIIAEKPSVANDIAKVLGASSKKDTHWEGKDIVVTWAIGHLLQLKYMDCRQLCVQALRDRNLCRLVKVGTEENLSDMFTKILGPIKFEAVRDKMMYSHPLPEAAKAA